jgi:hypothetical protein
MIRGLKKGIGFGFGLVDADAASRLSLDPESIDARGVYRFMA